MESKTTLRPNVRPKVRPKVCPRTTFPCLFINGFSDFKSAVISEDPSTATQVVILMSVTGGVRDLCDHSAGRNLANIFTEAINDVDAPKIRRQRHSRDRLKYSSAHPRRSPWSQWSPRWMKSLDNVTPPATCRWSPKICRQQHSGDNLYCDFVRPLMS